MALITRYVDPDATGTPINGTTWSQAYRSLSAWNTAEANDLVTAGNTHEVHCRSSSGTADTTAVTMSTSWIMDATHTLLIVVDQTDRHDGKWNASKYRLDVAGTTGTALIIGSRTYITIAGLQFSRGGTTGGLDISTASANPQLTIKNCIFKTTQYGFYTTTNITTANSVRISNCLFYDCGTTALYADNNNSSGITLYNATIADCGRALSSFNNGFVVKNAIFAYNTNPTTVAHMAAATDYISSTGTDVKGTNSRSSQTITFVNRPADDYHLASNDAGAKDFGANLSSDSLINVVGDVDGQSRTGTWDIGSDEYVATNSPSINGSVLASFIPGATMVAHNVNISGSLTTTFIPGATMQAVIIDHYNLQGGITTSLVIDGQPVYSGYGLDYNISGSVTTEIQFGTAMVYSGTPVEFKYVDPTATGTPIDGSTWDKAYRSLAAWHTAITDKNLVTRATRHIVYCRSNNGTPDTTAVNITGWTTNLTYNLTIENINLVGGKFNTTSSYRLDVATDNVIPLAISSSYVTIRNLLVRYNGTWSKSPVQILADDVSIRKCILVVGAGADANSDGILINSAVLTKVNSLKISNTLIYGAKRNGINAQDHAGQQITLYNCTIAKSFLAAISSFATGFRAKNCLFVGNSASISTNNFSADSGYNASDRADVVGTGSRASQVFSFADYTNNDYHLVLTDAGAKDHGADLSGDIYDRFTEDFDFNTRGTSGLWDIGADEFIASGSSYGLSASVILNTTINASMLYHSGVAGTAHDIIPYISTRVIPFGATMLHTHSGVLNVVFGFYTAEPDVPKHGNPGGWGGGGFRAGNNWVWCPVCGFTYRADKFKHTWDGRVVCKYCWEPRHEQDFLKARVDKLVPDLIQVEPDAVYNTLDDVEDSSTVPAGTFNNDL